MDSDQTLKILLPNKQSTILPVRDEIVLVDVLRMVCDRRQLELQDHFLQVENEKGKLEEVDLTLQLRQLNFVGEPCLHVARYKRKFFLKPSGSKSHMSRQNTNSTDDLSMQDSLEDLPNSGSKTLKKGRMRSISLSLKNGQRRMSVDATSGPSLADLARQLSTDTDSRRSSLSIDDPPPLSSISTDGEEVPVVEGSPLDLKKIQMRDSPTSKMTLTKRTLRPRSSTLTPHSEAAVVVLLRVTLPNGSQTMMKASPEMTLETVLKDVCERKGIDYDTHTIFVPTINDVGELDRPLQYYKMDPPIVTIIPSEQKTYSSMVVTEDGREVMVLHFVMGRFEVMSAAEDKLIEKLTDEQGTDTRFQSIMLLTYRSFMTPEDFFDGLVSRFNCEAPDSDDPEDLAYFTKNIGIVRRRVITVITQWAKTHWHDFVSSTELFALLQEFSQQLQAIGSTEPDIERAQADLQRAISEQTSRHKIFTNSMEELIVRKSKSMDVAIFLSAKPKEIAEQLALFDHELFSHIDGIEFLNQMWRDGPESERDCSHLLFFIERFNKESSWAATEVILEIDLQKRVTILRKLIEVIKECYEIKNFFSMFALLAGLGWTPVTRLKKTWAALPSNTKKLHEEMEKLTDPSFNMRAYREVALKATPPMIPFLPIFLKDLIFCNDGNPSRTEHKLVNFEKLRMMHGRIQELLAFAAVSYTFETLPELQNYMKTPRCFSLDKLLPISRQLEPPET